MRLSNWVRLVVLGAALLLVRGAGVAQINTADLGGYVFDPQGLAIPGAKVTVKNLATGIARAVETDTNGRYQFIQLTPGRYELTVEAGKGFAKLVNPEIVLTIGQVAEFDAHMQLQTGAESVTVTEAPELVEVSKTAVTDTIDKRQIDNLPIDGRNYINFTLTNSQAARDSAPSIGAAPTSGLNFGGQRARSNEVSVDGADAVDNSVNGVRSTVSQEAVQEFQLIISNYMPEFGRATGAVINIVTRGGTNEVHGNVFGYLRHKSIQARNPFSLEVDSTGKVVPVKQPFTRAQAGATLGGPVVKDKTFYFFSYETTRRQETGFTNIGANNFGFAPPGNIPCIPIPLTLTPDQLTFYQNTLGQLTGNGAACTNPNPVIQAQITGLQKAALITGAASNVALNADLNINGDGTPVPLSAVLGLPSALGSKFFPPAFTGVLASLPIPSYVGLNSLRGNYPVSEGTSLWSARLDHQWSQENSSFVRVSVSPSLVTGIQVNAQNQNAGANAASRTSVQQYRDVSVVGQHVTAFTTRLFNVARFQFARRGLHYGFAKFPGGGDVAVDILGVASFGREPFSTVDRIERRSQWTDNLSYVTGRHSFKVGADINWLQIRSNTNQVFQLDFGGLYRVGGLSASATGLPTALSPAQAYGMGLPTTFIQGIGSSGRFFNNYPLGFFIQDSWKLSHRVTLNYGVRYDLELSPLFTPASTTNAAAELALGVIEGIPRDYNNVQPRIGLAIDPFGKGRTVIRAGYGLFFDHPLLAVAFNSATADGAQSVQLAFGPGAPTTAALAPLNATSVLNAANVFQGTFNPGTFTSLGYQANSGICTASNLQRFDPCFPDSFFTSQNFLAPGTTLPLTFLPFTFPVSRDFVYGYAQQASLAVEQQIGGDFRLGLGYTFTRGLHLNRPRNVNAPLPTLLVSNTDNAVRSGVVAAGTNPLVVRVPTGPSAAFPAASCSFPPGVFPPGTIFVNTPGGGSLALLAPGALATGFTAPNCASAPLGFVGTPAVFNFFRPSGPNPSFGPFATLQALAKLAGYPAGPSVIVPFSDASNQESTGNSVYHSLTVTLSKRFARHFQFLSNYTWSHAIDDSTDLQSPLNPQDNRLPQLERSNSTFDQRHRWVTSAVIESPYQRSDTGWWRKFLADFTLAPIIEVSSGRPFNDLTAQDYNLDFGSTTDRPSAAASGGVTSPFIPGAHFVLPAEGCDTSGTAFTNVTFNGNGCRGNLGRNRFTRPSYFSVDLRISRKFYITERWNLQVIADGFNLLNRTNISDVSPLCDPGSGACNAGMPTAAFNARQFQFALKVNW